MASLDLSKLIEQLPGGGVARAFGCSDVEVVGLPLHLLGLGSDLFYAQRAHEPIGLALVVTPNVLPPDEGYAFAESAEMKVDQRVAMPVLLFGHFLKDPGRLGEPLPQPVRIGAVDAAVVLLRRYGQREHFLLRQ